MRIHIQLDDKLVEQIDAVAGPRGRSGLIREAVTEEVDRRRRRQAFERALGGAPNFAPGVTAESISEQRMRETIEYQERMRPHWRRD